MAHFAVNLCAAVITAILAGVAFLSDLLRRCCHIPLWSPLLVVFMLASAPCWLLFGVVQPTVPLIAGSIVTLAFSVYWAATAWLLRRLTVNRA